MLKLYKYVILADCHHCHNSLKKGKDTMGV